MSKRPTRKKKEVGFTPDMADVIDVGVSEIINKSIINKLKGTAANSIYLQAVRSHGGDGSADHNPFIGSDQIQSDADSVAIESLECVLSVKLESLAIFASSSYTFSPSSFFRFCARCNAVICIQPGIVGFAPALTRSFAIS